MNKRKKRTNDPYKRKKLGLYYLFILYKKYVPGTENKFKGKGINRSSEHYWRNQLEELGLIENNEASVNQILLDFNEIYGAKTKKKDYFEFNWRIIILLNENKPEELIKKMSIGVERLDLFHILQGLYFFSYSPMVEYNSKSAKKYFKKIHSQYANEVLPNKPITPKEKELKADLEKIFKKIE